MNRGYLKQCYIYETFTVFLKRLKQENVNVDKHEDPKISIVKTCKEILYSDRLFNMKVVIKFLFHNKKNKDFHFSLLIHRLNKLSSSCCFHFITLVSALSTFFFFLKWPPVTIHCYRPSDPSQVKRSEDCLMKQTKIIFWSCSHRLPSSS